MSVEIKNALTQLIATIENKPQVATSVFRASSFSETDSFAVQSQIRDLTTTIDEPLELGGIITATVLSLLALPVIYGWVLLIQEKRKAA